MQESTSCVCMCAGMLRNLSSYYFKDAPGLHLVRVAQGLLHAGKGLVTLSPHHADRTLLSPVSLASLLTVRSPAAAHLCTLIAHLVAAHSALSCLLLLDLHFCLRHLALSRCQQCYDSQFVLALKASLRARCACVAHNGAEGRATCLFSLF